MNSASGRPVMSLMPPRLRMSLSSSRRIICASFLLRRSSAPLDCSSSISCRRLIDCRMVLKLVSMPPSQRWFTKGMPQRVASSWIASRALRLVPTNSTLPPSPTTFLMKSAAWLYRGSDFSRLMMWILLRSPKMKGDIFGFQKRVWWPKWTPASSICRMDTLAMSKLLVGLVLRAPACGNRSLGNGTPPHVSERVWIWLRKNAALYTILGAGKQCVRRAAGHPPPARRPPLYPVRPSLAPAVQGARRPC